MCVCVKFLHLPPKAALGLSRGQWKLLLVWGRGVLLGFPPVPAGAEKGPCVADIGPDTLSCIAGVAGRSVAFRHSLLLLILTEHLLCARYCSGPWE